jgi:gingipain R/gingipain K
MKRKSLLFAMMLCFACFGAANAQHPLPYSYGFENYDLSADGWTTANPYSSNTSEFGIAAAAKHNGDYGFRFSSYSRNTDGYDQYLFSPELDGAGGVIMSFWYAASSTSGTELFKVGYSTTDTNISSFTWGNEISTYNTSWAQSEEFMFPAGTKYVAIWYYSNYQYRLFVDDFSFAAIPSCVKPTLSNEVILGMENASVQWTENGTATNWELQYSTNADFSAATTINRNGIPAYAIRDLSAATTYYARVRANCGGGDYSDWSNVITFTTWACENATAVEYNLTDSYGDGWNGNAIRIFDGCGDLVETLTIASGSTNSGTLSLCGDYYQFVWVAGSYASETSFTLTVNGTAIYSQQSGSDLTDGQVLHTIGIQPPVKPTALTAGTPGANEVQLSWTENGTATTWQICINDDENNLVVANSNPFTLTGLNALTAYTVKVRSTDGTNASCWSNVVSFTTDSSCPTPTNLTATNVMPTSATLNWEGNDDVESYNVRYRVAAGDVTIFEDGFENGLDNWTIYTQGEAPNAEGWVTYDASGINGVTNHGGSYVVSAWSWASNAYNADNWLVTPQIDLQGNLKFWETTAGQWPDSYEVLLSTSDNSISDFTITLREMQQATGDWSEVVIDLSSYAGQQGYIAIHHVSYDANYLFIDDFGIYGTQDAGEWINATSTTNSLDITGLSSLKNYEFQVQAVCGTDDESGWSDIANFPTPDGCAVPTDLTADVTGNAAELSWTGTTETYNLQYLEVDPTVPATIILNVPDDIWQDGTGYQMLLDADATAYGDVFTATGGWTATDYSAFEYLIPTDAECSADATHIVLENSVSIQIPAGTYDWCIVNPSPADSKIYIAASNGNVGGRQDDYVFESGMTYEFTPSLYGSNDGIDVTITDNNTWTLVESVNNPYTLENLSAQTTYKYQVQGVDCDGNGGTTDWSASASFTTPEFYTKTIEAYEGDGGYYLIASPLVNNVAPTDVTGMITDNLGANVDETTSTYDLYSFDQAQELEWRNYRASNFSLVNGQGYLYASKEGTELVFTGAGNTGNTQDVTLYMTDADADAATGLDFPDWNLVGNPFAKDNAYLNDGRAFYSMQNSGVYTPQLGPVAIGPMEGVFVVANSNEETLTFTTTQPNKKVAQLTLNLTKSASAGSTLLDRAIVSFDEGNQLPKLQFRNGSTKVYMPMDGKEYAIVSAEAMGTMPVNFKAENNGSYTLNFTAEEVNFAYLHLIDNMNGNDVDLLANPSYTFDAKTTDYESRFKLVFAAGNSNDDTFAFYSNGSFVINNEGNATLQVIDVNGRILKSESINGCANVNVNAAQGIYMLRLVNGDNVKVQKVVVR